MEDYGIVMYSRMQGKIFVYSPDKDFIPSIEIDAHPEMDNSVLQY